jgi:acetyl esterase
MPNLKSDAHLCRKISTDCACVCLDFDYPKAPEHPWPAQHEAIERFVDWLGKEVAAKGWDASNLSVGGLSSGGLLALVVASSRPHLFKAVSAFYPSCVSCINVRFK